MENYLFCLYADHEYLIQKVVKEEIRNQLCKMNVIPKNEHAKLHSH